VLDQTGDRTFGSANISTLSGRVLTLIVVKVKRQIVEKMRTIKIASAHD